jgi:hypothetical protein
MPDEMRKEIEAAQPPRILDCLTRRLSLDSSPRLLVALVVEADEMSNNPDSSYKPEPRPIYSVGQRIFTELNQ